MVIKYRVVGWLKNHITGKEPIGTVEMDKIVTVLDMIELLGFESTLPVTAVVNDMVASKEQQLKDGDALVIIPSIGGG